MRAQQDEESEESESEESEEEEEEDKTVGFGGLSVQFVDGCETR